MASWNEFCRSVEDEDEDEDENEDEDEDAALHGCLCMLMFQMMTPNKGCIDVTMLSWNARE